MDAKSIRANFLLLLTAVIWGGGFVAQRVGMEDMGPFLFNGFRFTLGAFSLLPFLSGRRAQGSSSSWKSTLAVGSAAGLFLFAGATLQQVGLVFTTAGKAGFVTGLYVVLVPLLGMIWGDRAPFQTWIGAVLAVIGLYFLSGTERFTLARGDSYVLLGAFFWAGHVQFIANFSRRHNPIRLSFVQAVATALLSFAVGFLAEDFSLPLLRQAAVPLIYGGVISIGIAYTLQVVAQQTARPSHAAILLSLEAVFAVIWGWLILQETLAPRGVAGSLLMLMGMLLSQLKVYQPGKKKQHPPG